MKRRYLVGVYFFITLPWACCFVNAQTVGTMKGQYRPQVHFSPQQHWVNDPNGMVFYKGIYHLFFQYHPNSSVWGPMHWGHTISKDLVHWQQQPIAIYPDSLGTIFSGSAVVDISNTSGFGKNGKVPLVAIFTQHDTVGEKAGKNNFQNQSIAYSLDEGKTWVKYAGNPVIKNPGFRDFRDPKVMWHAPAKKWIMSLAVQDNVTFYSSPDLKNWTRESDFGKGRGAHGGGWECPDLFSMDDNGKQRWVLIVNLNPGAPNGGSGTQYFIGDFDGKNFISDQQETKWLDYGPDNYAGITWSNTGDRKIFIGWMSNWMYANLVPTTTWRNAMTIPRELRLMHVGNDLLLASAPVKELIAIENSPVNYTGVTAANTTHLTQQINPVKLPCRINLSTASIQDFAFTLSNNMGEELVIGFDKNANQYFIDRTKSGKTDFEKGFAARHTAPRFSMGTAMDMSVIIDESSIELFADKGLTVMTEIFFPSRPYNTFHLTAAGKIAFSKVAYIPLKSIWP